MQQPNWSQYQMISHFKLIQMKLFAIAYSSLALPQEMQLPPLPPLMLVQQQLKLIIQLIKGECSEVEQ